MTLPDIQDQPDTRGIDLDEVGIAGVRFPVTIDDGTSVHAGVASVDVTVTLPAERRGTHMSRMVELINEHLVAFDPREWPTTLKSVVTRLDVDAARVALTLPVAFETEAPTSGRSAWQPADATFEAILRGGAVETLTTAETDVTSVCPCSKAISDYGAHNQRSRVTLVVLGSDDEVYPLPIRRQFELIRTVGSSPVYPLIKRVDERTVTMLGHDNPAFVEDMARDLSGACRELGIGHRVSIRNLESIHSHDAVAQVAWCP